MNVGPLNRCAKWTDQITTGSYQPVNKWIGFSACLNSFTEDKQYWVGIAGDNNFRLVLDGVEILNTISGPFNNRTPAFNYWHIYPVNISKGEHILELYGQNSGNIAGFGCEIYDATLQELLAATTLSQINIIFTSQTANRFELVQNLDGTYTSSGYSCPPTYSYASCSGTCRKIVECCPEPDPSRTPTPTPTISVIP